MLSFHVKSVQTDGQTDGRTDGRTTVKQYALDLSIRGHKNMFRAKIFGSCQTLPANLDQYIL